MPYTFKTNKFCITLFNNTYIYVIVFAIMTPPNRPIKRFRRNVNTFSWSAPKWLLRHKHSLRKILKSNHGRTSQRVNCFFKHFLFFFIVLKTKYNPCQRQNSCHIRPLRKELCVLAINTLIVTSHNYVLKCVHGRAVKYTNTRGRIVLEMCVIMPVYRQ